jgi:hypothetical protein
VVSGIVQPCSYVDGIRRFGGSTASILRVEVRDRGDVSTEC